MYVYPTTKRSSWPIEFIEKTERYIIEKVIPLYNSITAKHVWARRYGGYWWEHACRTTVANILYRSIISIGLTDNKDILILLLNVNGTSNALRYHYHISSNILESCITREEQSDKWHDEYLKNIERKQKLKEQARQHQQQLEQDRIKRRAWIVEHVIKNEMYSAARAASIYNVNHATITNDIKMIGRQFGIPKWVGKDWKDILVYLRNPIGTTSKHEHEVAEYLNQVELEAQYKKYCDFIEVMVEEIDGHSLLSTGCYRTPKRRRAE